MLKLALTGVFGVVLASCAAAQLARVPVTCSGPQLSQFSGCAVFIGKDKVPVYATGSGGRTDFSSCSGSYPKFQCQGIGRLDIDLTKKTITQ